MIILYILFITDSLNISKALKIYLYYFNDHINLKKYN